jgi:hypothetical protein
VNASLIALVVILLLTTLSPRAALFGPKASVPKTHKIALGESGIKDLLLLMDTDKNGKISRQEFIAFMEVEFARLDKNKNGELDVKGFGFDLCRLNEIQRLRRKRPFVSAETLLQ